MLNLNDGCDHKPFPPPRSVVASTARLRKPRSYITAMKSLEPVIRRKNVDDEVISCENLDEWMKESVVDIVKNLREAPLFVRFYKENGKTARFETEKAVEEDRWPILENQWKNGAEATPEGIIFVQKLEDEEEEEEEVEMEGEPKAWGIVVQGRGVERGAPVCYLLKTSRAAGLGLWCTHFCLVRVKNFRETTKSQLQNCWLMQNQ